MKLLAGVEAFHEALDEADGLPHVVGRPPGAGRAPKFIKNVPDVLEAAEAADDVQGGADDA